MKDQMRKNDTIRRIEKLQLSCHLIGALDDVKQADVVLEAVLCLEQFTEQWN